MNSSPHAQAGAWSRVVLVGALILLLSMGVRATAGIFMPPMLVTHGWSREFFSNTFAIQNLAWGAGAVLMGMLADRIGAARAIALAGLIYAVGLAGTLWVDSQLGLVVFFGLLVGIGQGGTTSALVMPVIGRATSPLARSAALGVANAGGSLGQFLVVPAGHLLIELFDWHAALLIMSMAVALIAPLAFLMHGRSAAAQAGAGTAAAGQGTAEAPHGAAAQAGDTGHSLWTAVRDAFRRKPFALLAGSYFVCGFQLAFITLHLPAYVVDNGLAASHGAMAIATIGLFNVIGSFAVGWLGGRHSKKMLLGWVYALRAVFVGLLLVLPISAASLYLFAAGMGLLWLSTVPLTMGLVGQIFGLRYAATLGGFVFLSHQIGSATGVWIAGRSYAASGSYDVMWFASIALALAAAALAWMIDERPDAGATPAGRGGQPVVEPGPNRESSFARAALSPEARPASNAYSSSIRSA
jgi:MFS family permease